jgi:predicted Zn-dependent protease with MMP-like domain
MPSAPEHSDTPDRGEVSDLDDRAFNELEDNVERLAAQSAERTDPGPSATRANPAAPIRTQEEFKQAVRNAIDELPGEAREALESVVITVSDEGAKEHAYGRYSGRTASYSYQFSRPDPGPALNVITIYRDTLTRDFGNDPAGLRAQITRTVRHEVAHHLGFNEDEVRRLGL